MLVFSPDDLLDSGKRAGGWLHHSDRRAEHRQDWAQGEERVQTAWCCKLRCTPGRPSDLNPQERLCAIGHDPAHKAAAWLTAIHQLGRGRPPQDLQELNSIADGPRAQSHFALAEHRPAN
jgi:hypothetical protein